VNYDQAQKLHRVRVNFRLPVLRSVGEILRAENAVLKRGAKSPKVSQTIENTGAPERGKSALLHRHTLRQVPWLVYITATHNGNVVAEQLQRNGVDEWTQAFFGFGNLYHVIRQIIQAGVAF